ncbi:dienelactone hydrolase [Paraburkholderia silvatlantica]|uniref:Dienelactone hydrolase n=2 Tax=Paraburkholderia silvatlantica TaxID=321895 RepID=A0ABR6FKA2_9BURK|nr:dienelactone hydrolase family protein [Paraburkholderia silvatlantica]MBB2927846.1 dienelactone hydrolase [Paraburkholderia silvatlantica]PVY27589.1 dienelactone hydrolase [Paraburkholderia silvatlantica]PXW34562.1 dienelactone hydrolase [Paraburkholderia silvatlantica]
MSKANISQLIRIALICICSCLATAGHAQVTRMEVIPIPSVTLTDQEFLSGREDGKPVTVAGELRIPRSGTDRLPLVIMLHSSGGVGSSVTDWEEYFLSLGVATFVIDSFSGRGIVSTINDQSQLGRLAQTEDAYRAMAALSKHPGIDPNRIVLMGFSRGGQNALYASLSRFQRMHAQPGTQFAAFIAFYPDCTYTYLEDENVVSRPVRIFQGTADNYNPVAPCRAYVERLKTKVNDVQLTEYAGAGHFFDARALKQPQQLSQAQTTRNCLAVEVESGLVVNARTRQPFSYSDPCVERGATIAYDENAAAKARQAVGEIVRAVLKP